MQCLPLCILLFRRCKQQCQSQWWRLLEVWAPWAAAWLRSCFEKTSPTSVDGHGGRRLRLPSNSVRKVVARIVAGGSINIFATSEFNFSSCESLDLTLVRRVASAEPDAFNRVNVQRKGIIANYDELIQDGTISLAPYGPCPIM